MQAQQKHLWSWSARRQRLHSRLALTVSVPTSAALLAEAQNRRAPAVPLCSVSTALGPHDTPKLRTHPERCVRPAQAGLLARASRDPRFCRSSRAVSGTQSSGPSSPCPGGVSVSLQLRRQQALQTAHLAATALLPKAELQLALISAALAFLETCPRQQACKPGISPESAT